LEKRICAVALLAVVTRGKIAVVRALLDAGVVRHGGTGLLQSDNIEGAAKYAHVNNDVAQVDDLGAEVDLGLGVGGDA